MKTRPEVTEEEIRNFMDFDGVLQLKKKTDGRERNIRRMRNVLLALTLLLVPGSIVLLNRTDRSQRNRQTIESASPSYTPAPFAVDTVEKVLIPLKSQSSNTVKQAVPGPLITDRKSEKIREGGTKKSGPVKSVYLQAEPINGYPLLYEYFNTHLVYPSGAVKDSIEGIVNVVFVIDTAGKAKNITLENSLGPLFDEEAIRVVKDMPLWRSASYNGKPVESKVSLPITFEIKKIANE